MSLPVDKIRALDKKARDLGFSEKILIENASSNLFGVIDSLSLGFKALAVSGRGNNGADVLSCARKLASRGYRVAVVTLEEEELRPEAAWQKDMLIKSGLKVQALDRDNLAQLADLIKEADFIVEGIVGLGLKGELDPFLAEAVKLINSSSKPTVSCDIPSGLDPDQGLILGQAVKADYTVTFLAQKPGFSLNQGPQLCGKIFVVDIGISRAMLEK